MHEATHRIVFGRVVRNPGAAQQVRDFLVGTDPNREHRLGRTEALLAILADDAGHGCGDVISRSDRSRDIHHQESVIARVGQQYLECCRIACGVGVADDIDRIRSRPRRRQNRVKSFADSRFDRGRDSTEFGKPIDRQNTDTAAIGQDRQPFPRRRFDPPQRLGAVKQLAKIRYPQDPGATERRVIDLVRAGQRAGVGRRGFCPLRHAAGFDDDDGLDPRSRARGRHEFPGVLDRFDVEQDRVRLAVQREVIEQVGDIDVELIADGRDPGKSHAALRRPIHHARGDGAGLRNQREISRGRHVRGEARIEGHARHHNAEAIRSDQPRTMLTGGALGGLRQRSHTMAEARGDDKKTCDAETPCLVDEASDCRGRSCNHDEVGDKSQLVQAADRGEAVNFGIMRIHQAKLTLEFRLENVAENGPSDGPGPWAGSDQRDRTGRQQAFESIRGHQVNRPAGAGLRMEPVAAHIPAANATLAPNMVAVR